MSSCQSDPTIVETIPDSIIASILANNRLVMYCVDAMTGLVILYIAFNVAHEVGWIFALIGGMVFWLPCVLFSIGWYAAKKHELLRRIPTVELSHGELTVRYGSHVLTADVKDCRLRRGRACRMQLPGGPKLHCYASVILIDLPSSSLSKMTALLWGSRVRVAVGYTQETQDQWERVLLSEYQSGSESVLR